MDKSIDRTRISLTTDVMDKLEELAGAVGLTPAQYVRFLVATTYNKQGAGGGFPVTYDSTVRRKLFSVYFSEAEVEWLDQKAKAYGLKGKSQVIRLALGKLDE